MQRRLGTTETLARFVVHTQREGIPTEARHEATRALLNFFAVELRTLRLQ